MPSPNKVWLDCDPGHDDAIAILLALHLPQVELVGISTVHGNGTLEHTTLNAARLVCSFTSRERAAALPVHQGARKPLLRAGGRHDTEIHGDDGLGGVEGLLDVNDEAVRRKVEEATKGAVEALAEAARSLPDGQRLTLVATGALTNAALFVATYPELVRDKLDEIVLMGGAEGRGNRSPTAEFNILCDPEAAQMVFDAEIKVVMVPLNITHTNLFTPEDNKRLLRAIETSPHSTGASTPLRHTLSTLLNFFGDTYASVFGFVDGPPVHDPLCIAYLLSDTHPELFKGKRYRVDVETVGVHTAGTTSVDLYGYRDKELTAMKDPESRESWGQFGKNVYVLEQVDVRAFWDLFQQCVDSADLVSPLNQSH